jgi:predicted ABC-type transport system involved in lysophospholipase L1 biosynthesis ATPase subunit
MVIVTHDTTVARRAQQTGVMKEGRLLLRLTATDATG